MRRSQNEERLSNLVFISMNKDILKKMMARRSADTVFIAK